MSGYIPMTEAERREMLAALGLSSMDELFDAVPEAVRIASLDIPDGAGELGAARIVKGYAAKNRAYETIFRGAGAYRHFIPSIVKSVTAKEEFLTAYTPYQAEISQGTLQAMFEYQTEIAALTGMDASNASVYDGATAAAEAVAMLIGGKRTKALVSAAVHPMIIETLMTYAHAAGREIALIPAPDGRTDLSAMADMISEDSACVLLAQPNYFGLIEDAEAAAGIAHQAGIKCIVSVHPIACAALKTPGEIGADIAVGEGQPLGLPMSFGGPYLGFMAVKKDLLRKLPGRIVGETTDAQGERAFVLTLQAREQHIRREKASSNICSNEALCAVTAAVYMAAMGPEGLREVAAQCHAKAVYLEAAITAIPSFERLYPGDFFHEFATKTPVPAETILSALAEKGVLGGLPIEGGMLWCATEMNTREEIDALAHALREVAK